MKSTNARMTPTGPRRTRATAKIQVTVEIEAGTWGPECTVDQVLRQAASDALAKVSRLVGDAGHVSNPKVIAVLVEEVL